MCITVSPAQMGGTQVYTYLSSRLHGGQPVHVTAYQNNAVNLTGDPNCMILHFPSQGMPELVSGPEHTRRMMSDVVDHLPELVPTPRSRDLQYAGAAHKAVVEPYGDYHVVLAEYPQHILDALDQVPESRRPRRTAELDALVEWYRTTFPDYAFVLACFSGKVVPSHPIVVSYVPDNDDVLFAPGLDGHDGRLPIIGVPTARDFHVAFGIDGHRMPLNVHYHDDVAQAWWAPRTVTGFYDNRPDGPNTDYTFPLETLRDEVMGNELMLDLVS